MIDGMGMMVWGLFSFLLGLLLTFLLNLAVFTGVINGYGAKRYFLLEGKRSVPATFKKNAMPREK